MNTTYYLEYVAKSVNNLRLLAKNTSQAPTLTEY